MSLARLVVTAVRVEGRTKAEVSRDYGVSPRWVFELCRRFDAEGEEWVDLYNSSSQTVKITHVGPTVPSLYTLPGMQWSLSSQISNPGAQGGLGLRPWHPVTLPPGGGLETLITVHMTGCFHQDSYEVFGDTPVTYSVWGVRDQQMVPMDFSVTMKGNGGACP